MEGWAVSSSTPGTSSSRNSPLRSRSARTIALATPSEGDAFSSSRKRATATGIWVAPTPLISTRNWARAGVIASEAAVPARAAHTWRRRRSMRFIEVIVARGL